MPLCTVHLVQLSLPIRDFLVELSSDLQEQPLVVSRVIRWIIRPESLDVSPLLDHPWDLLLVLGGTDGLPRYLRTPRYVRQLYTLKAGIPSALVKDFQKKNARLLKPRKRDIPGLTESLENPRVAASAQDLELSPELQSWIPAWIRNGAASGKGAVSMLNLLTFKPGMHEEYLKYGKAFGESIGKRRGGNAKLVGKIVPEGGQKSVWDEFALAHYPSLLHFEDMIASADYQEVNHKHRVHSLADTCILMTSELEIPGNLGGTSRL